MVYGRAPASLNVGNPSRISTKNRERQLIEVESDTIALTSHQELKGVFPVQILGLHLLEYHGVRRTGLLPLCKRLLTCRNHLGEPQCSETSILSLHPLLRAAQHPAMIPTFQIVNTDSRTVACNMHVQDTLGGAYRVPGISP